MRAVENFIHIRFSLNGADKGMLRKLGASELRGYRQMLSLAVLFPLQALAAEPLVRPKSACFSIPEAREEITRNHLTGSFKVLKNIAKKYRSEALAGKLCKKGELYIYEVTLLRHDGRVIHVFANARDGEVTKARNDK